MKFSFIGKPNVVSEALKEKTIEKMSKLSKFLPEDTELNVAYKVTKLENKIKVTFTAFKRTLRAEVKATDMYSAIDDITEVLEKQLRRLKTRLQDRSKKAFKGEITQADEQDPILESTIIVNRKSFVINQMDIEDAIMEMELSGHNFYLFRNTETNEVNVVYKSKEKNHYGVIDPS